MAGVTGMGTTFNLPNFTGNLFTASPEDTPLLSVIGGLTGGAATRSTRFEWQSYDLRDASANRQRLEGATAPESELRTRTKGYNVVEIHQEALELSYTRLATRDMINSDGDELITIGSVTMPLSELEFQVNTQFKQIARDVEQTFLTGTFQDPEDNETPRKTRGLLEAIETNVAVAENLTEDAVLNLMQTVWESGGIQESETRTVIVNGTLKRALSNIFISGKGYKEESRTVGGVSLETFITDFGRCNIMLDRYMPAKTLAVASLEQLKPRFLEIPNKGHFFIEPLAKTGASEKFQIYGEIGLEYGNELSHGKLTVA